MSNRHKQGLNRRAFLKASLAAVALGGCGLEHRLHSQLTVTAAMKARRIAGDSTVALVSCKSYEENILQLLKPYLSQLSLPTLKNKTVVIKPNMVEFNPDKPIHTDPIMLVAACELVDTLGAKEIIIAEGPGHYRDTEFLLEATGIGKACAKLGLPFVDLNLDDLEQVENKDGFTRPKHFFLPRTIVGADALVSLPKLKTHHWVAMTASMKNLFGTLPGRKYGWPKNIIHVEGITPSILDVVRMVRPTFALVDAVVAMEGDGPVNGTAKPAGFLVVGQDLAAVDATCARAMKLNPTDIDYLKLAGEIIGNVQEEHIKLIGSPISTICQSFAMPITFQNKELTSQAANQGS